MLDQNGQVAVYPAPIPMKGPNGMPLMDNNRPILCYPMLDPMGGLFRDGNGNPLIECHILGLDGMPIMY